MKVKFLLFFICFSGYSATSFSETKSSVQDRQKAVQFLKKILKKYQNQHLHFQIKKTLFLPTIDETIKEKGNFFISKKKFRLDMNGDPGYLMIYDGNYLWYQSDKKEKIVFKLKNHPQILFFFQLFNPDQFLTAFSIQNFKTKNRKVYTYSLTSNQKDQDIKEIQLTVGNYIEEIKITWDNLGQWQQYKFLNPWTKSGFSKSKFQFSEKDYEIILKESF